MSYKKWIVLSSLAILNLNCSGQDAGVEIIDREPSSVRPKVIYGDDSRRDWFETFDTELIDLAESTVGIIDTRSVRLDGDNAKVDTYNYRLCPSERFSDQQVGPWCSGFLVGPDLVVTAGHCIDSRAACNGSSMVFDFAKKSSTHEPANIKSKDVYKCKEIVAQKFTELNADWALIRLDRPVEGRRPLRIRRSGSPSVGSPLILIGHPSGLPSKIAKGGHVRSVEREYFEADLDSYGGNSGSAVFNAETKTVEGILVRGRTDYVFKNGCYVSNVCEDGLGGKCEAEGNFLKAEHVMKISEIAHLIPEVDENNVSKPDEKNPELEDPENVFSSQLLVPIPDSSLNFASSTISSVPELESTENLKVYIELEHTYISDLSVKLIAPNGKAVYVHYKTGRAVVNIKGVYGRDLESAQNIAELGAQPSGKWELKIIDHAPYDKGQLIKWSLIL